MRLSERERAKERETERERTRERWRRERERNERVWERRWEKRWETRETERDAKWLRERKREREVKDDRSQMISFLARFVALIAIRATLTADWRDLLNNLKINHKPAAVKTIVAGVTTSSLAAGNQAHWNASHVEGFGPKRDLRKRRSCPRDSQPWIVNPKEFLVYF